MSTISHDVARSYQHYGRENLSDWELSALDAHVAVCRECQEYSQALEGVRQALQRLKLAQWGKIRPTEAHLIRRIHARLRRNHIRQQLSTFATSVGSVAVLVGLVIVLASVLLSLRPPPRPQASSASGPALSVASPTLPRESTKAVEPTATGTFVPVESWSPRGFFPIASGDKFTQGFEGSLPLATLSPSELEGRCQLTLSEAQAQAGFRVVIPAVAPLGYGLRCVTYVTVWRAVELTYGTLDEPFPLVTITQWLGPTPPSDDIGVGLTARIVPLRVRDLDAEYVAGNWWFDYPTSTTVQGHWDAAFPLARLRWLQNGHLMEISVVDVADDTGRFLHYPAQVLVEIGETLRSGPP